MKNQRKYQKGITLIALVITIIVLLILAGVTLSIVFNGGIINKSQKAVDKYTEEQAKEKLSLALFEYKMDKVTKKEGTNLQTTLSKLGPVIEAEDTNYYEVEIDGYLFWVHKDTLEIISKGSSNPVPPTKIEFTETTAVAYIGEGKTFSLKLEPQNANSKFLKWSVSDESIATIQNGVLTGLKEGTVTVTVTSTEDASRTASFTVTIKPIELTKITLNKTSTTIGMGKTETLEVTYTPANATYKDIIWSTSDDKIATVENGTIKGIAAGTATITATSSKNSSIKAECSVTVEEIIEISTVTELKAFRDNVNSGNTYAGKKVVLTNDLDLNPGKYTVESDGAVIFNSDAEQWIPIGTSFDKYFEGSFDGQGNSITGLYIVSKNKQNNYQGFFGCVRGEKTIISNLDLKNVNIQANGNVGGIVGYAHLCQSIQKCTVSGNIKGNIYTSGSTTLQTLIGGIAGLMVSGKIENCYNNAIISVETSSMDCYNVGGIIGFAQSETSVSNCYNVKSINGINYTGGIVGFIQGNINNCYNIGEISGSNYIGGICALYSTSSEKIIKNCYNSGNITGNSNTGSVIGCFNAENSNVENCSYLTGTSSAGIGTIAAGTATIEASGTLPSVLSVINGDHAFVEDTNNINDGYPILSFQQ